MRAKCKCQKLHIHNWGKYLLVPLRVASRSMPFLLLCDGPTKYSGRLSDEHVRRRLRQGAAANSSGSEFCLDLPYGVWLYTNGHWIMTRISWGSHVTISCHCRCPRSMMENQFCEQTFQTFISYPLCLQHDRCFYPCIKSFFSNEYHPHPLKTSGSFTFSYGDALRFRLLLLLEVCFRLSKPLIWNLTQETRITCLKHTLARSTR